jgi:hypothetical protein
MTAIEIFRRNHRMIRKALVSFERAILTQTGPWDISVRNLATFLDLQLREYWGAEERLVFTPLDATGPDARAVVRQMLQDHRDLEQQLAALKALTRPGQTVSASEVQERGLALVRVFLHHLFLEEELGFVLAEERLGSAHLEDSAARMLLLKDAERGLEEPAAID